MEFGPGYHELCRHFMLVTCLKKIKKATIPHRNTHQGPKISFTITKLPKHYPGLLCLGFLFPVRQILQRSLDGWKPDATA